VKACPAGIHGRKGCSCRSSIQLTAQLGRALRGKRARAHVLYGFELSLIGRSGRGGSSGCNIHLLPSSLRVMSSLSWRSLEGRVAWMFMLDSSRAVTRPDQHWTPGHALGKHGLPAGGQ
jgi:hypothetical protein